MVQARNWEGQKPLAGGAPGLRHGCGFALSVVISVVAANNWSCQVCPCKTQEPLGASSSPPEMVSSWVWEISVADPPRASVTGKRAVQSMV